MSESCQQHNTSMCMADGAGSAQIRNTPQRCAAPSVRNGVSSLLCALSYYTPSVYLYRGSGGMLALSMCNLQHLRRCLPPIVVGVARPSAECIDSALAKSSPAAIRTRLPARTHYVFKSGSFGALCLRGDPRDVRDPLSVGSRRWPWHYRRAPFLLMCACLPMHVVHIHPHAHVFLLSSRRLRKAIRLHIGVLHLRTTRSKLDRRVD